MSRPHPAHADGARALASAFDQGFAVARTAAPPVLRDFLSIRIGGDSHAIALTELAELVPLGKLTMLPGGPQEFLGLVGVRGVAVPVYDLRVLLGYAAGGEVAPWLAILAAARVALAFDAVEGHLRLPEEDGASEGTGSAQRHARHALRSADAVLPLLDTGSILGAIRNLASSPSAHADA